jgi:hypothetical protein
MLQEINLVVELELADALQDDLAGLMIGGRGTTNPQSASAAISFSLSAFDLGSIAISIMPGCTT